MASGTDLETLVLRIEANTAQYKKQMQKLVADQKSNTRKIIKTNKDTAASFQRTAQSIAVLHGPLGGVASRFSSMATLVRGSGVAMAGFAVAASAVTFGVTKLIKKFAEAEVAFQTTKGLLRATGFAAGKTAQDIESLSRDIGMGTLASTSEVRKAANILLTFRTVSGNTFNRTLRLAQDMVASGFGSITTNVVQLGKALESPREGLTALKRIGVDFSETQKTLIRKLADTGKRLEAQKEILAGVARQMEGAGIAAAQSLSGSFDSLSESSQKLFEHWGGLIVRGTGLTKVVGEMAARIEKMNADPLAHQIAVAEKTLQAIQKNKADLKSTFGQTVGGFLGGNLGTGGDDPEATAVRKLDQLRMQMHDRHMLRLSQGRIAHKKSLMAQQEIAEAQVEGVKAELNEKIRLKKLTEEQIMAEQMKAKAGVEASSEEGKQIDKLVEQYMHLTEVKKQSADATKRANKEAIQSLKQEMKAAQKQAEYFGNTVFDALSNVIFEGAKASDVIRNLGKTLAKAALQNLFVGTGPLSGGKSGGGIFTTLASSLFAGGGPVQAFASGGVVNGPTMFPMKGGRRGLMGEAGPEAIMPLSRGRDGKLGVQAQGGGTVINFHVNASDADSFVRSEGQIAAMLNRVVSRGQRNL